MCRILLTLSLFKHGCRRGGIEAKASRFAGAWWIRGVIDSACWRALIRPTQRDFITVGTCLIDDECGIWFQKWSKLVWCSVLLEGQHNSGVIYSYTHLLLEIPHCQQITRSVKCTFTGLWFSEMWSLNGFSLKFSEGKGITTFTWGFHCLSKLTQFCFHSFLARDNLGKHNALLEYGVFEPVCFSEFPPPSLLSQESLSFARWSTSTFIFFVAVGCFPVMRNTCKVQMIWLRLECFSHSWCWHFRFHDYFVSFSFLSRFFIY